MNKTLVHIARQPLLRRPVRALVRLHDLYSEQVLNVRTGGCTDFGDELSVHRDALPYEGTPYHILRAIFKRLPFDPAGEVFADYGCGKGRVVSFAARHPFARVVGLELKPELAALARRNVAASRGRCAPVEIIETDVVDFDCHDVTVFFYFNPFGAATTETVLDNIHESLLRNPRRILIVLYNPIQSAVFRARPWLRCNEQLGFEGVAMLQAPHRSCVEFFEHDSRPRLRRPEPSCSS